MSVPVHKIQFCFKICFLEFEQRLYFVDANVSFVGLRAEDVLTLSFSLEVKLVFSLEVSSVTQFGNNL